MTTNIVEKIISDTEVTNDTLHLFLKEVLLEYLDYSDNNIASIKLHIVDLEEIIVKLTNGVLDIIRDLLHYTINKEIYDEIKELIRERLIKPFLENFIFDDHNLSYNDINIDLTYLIEIDPIFNVIKEINKLGFTKLTNNFNNIDMLIVHFTTLIRQKDIFYPLVDILNKISINKDNNLGRIIIPVKWLKTNTNSDFMGTLKILTIYSE